jgi:hypothetical protein
MFSPFLPLSSCTLLVVFKVGPTWFLFDLLPGPFLTILPQKWSKRDQVGDQVGTKKEQL